MRDEALVEAERAVRQSRFKVPDRRDLEKVMVEYDRREEWMRAASKTILALALQAAELREALARVDPDAEARLHAKHKWESAS